MSDTTCSVDGCGRPVHCRSLCPLHYGRLRRNGSPGDAVLRKRPSWAPPAPCIIEGCSRPVEGKGLCVLHYIRLRRTGDAGPAAPLIRQSGRGPCSVAGCDRDADAAQRLCKLHYGRLLKTGSVGAASPIQYAQTTGSCSVDGCDRQLRAVALRLCATHYTRLLRSGSPGGAIRPQQARIPDATCSLKGCFDPVEARGYCRSHYFAWYHQQNPDRVMAAGRRRRARLMALPSEPYAVADIFARDGADCVLCGKPLDLAAKWPEPRSATVEHLECLSWPGSAGDVLANVAASHARCNLRRKAKHHPAAARKRAELLAAQSIADQEAST
jgi:hypothetical protein